jgi:hypothetical protein
MDTISISISFIVTIFGIAYPILFQVVSRLDEKYSSILILNLFNREKERRFFRISLISSLIAILIYVLKLPPLFDFGKLDFLINNSALVILISTTAALIVSFFYFVEKILTYYTPTLFLKYLIRRHNEVKDNNYIHFKAISDLLYNSIIEQNETISRTISDFLSSAFQNIREKSENDEVEYPASFYEIVYKSIEELANQKSKRLAFLEYQTTGGVLFFGGSDTKLSKTTSTWIWRNLLLMIKYERDDLIMYYWQNAHQYFSYQLGTITAEHSQKNFEVINEKEIENRDKERVQFLEFHYALGGLLFG